MLIAHLEVVLEVVVPVRVPCVPLGPLVEGDEELAVAHVREDVVLLGQDPVRVAGHRGAVSHEVRHCREKF